MQSRQRSFEPRWLFLCRRTQRATIGQRLLLYGQSREQTLTVKLSNVLARLHRHHDNTSSVRVIVHRAPQNPGIGSTEHERPEWVDPAARSANDRQHKQYRQPMTHMGQEPHQRSEVGTGDEAGIDFRRELSVSHMKTSQHAYADN